LNPSPTLSQESDPRLLAAVMAAVQAYLDQEAKTSDSQTDTRLSAWRITARADTVDTQSWRRLPWKGSD
jgi:seryl-tRNA(Sec) selenium transferase